jgi:hypothetical protein
MKAALLCRVPPWIFGAPLGKFGFFFRQQLVEHGDLPSVGFGGQ